jgi:intein/homing endonuclease
METFYDPIALAECMITDFDVMSQFDENKFGEIRLGQFPVMSYEYCLDYNPELSYKENFKLKEGAGNIWCFGGRKWGKCLHTSDKILLSNGSYIEAGSLIGKQEFVKSLNQTTEQIEDSLATFHDNGLRKCLKITLKSGKVTTVTENHPLLRDDGWVMAQQLEIGDFIGTPRRINISNGISVDKNIAKILGYMIADGSCNNGRCDFTKSDKFILEDFFKTVNSLGCKYSEYKADTTWGISGKDGNPNYIRELIKKYKIDKLSKEKTIPEEIFTWDNESISTFLNTLFGCDGHIDKSNNSIEYTSASKELIWQLSSLLLRFGVHCTCNYKKATCDGKEFDAWRLSICGDNNEFIEKIGMISKDRDFVKKEKLHSNKDLIPSSLLKKIYKDLKYKNQLGWRKCLRYNSSRTKYAKLNEVEQNPDIARIINSDIYWDTIISIEDAGVCPTVAIDVPFNENFIANDIISHNTKVIEEVDILLNMVLSPNEWVGFSSFDSGHILGVMEPVIDAMEKHPFLKIFEPKVKRSPSYRITANNGWTLESINMNIMGKNVGENWFQKHFTRIYIEEASKEPQESYDKRLDAISENGCVFRIAGMTDFTKYSPAGKIFYDNHYKNWLCNLPQFISPKWDNEEKLRAIKKHGGENAISYRVFVNAEVVEEGISVFDMERVRACYDESRLIKHLEITKKTFDGHKQLLSLVERNKSATDVYICADIGEAAPTEITIFSRIEDKYRYEYNISLYGLTDKEQYEIFIYLAEKLRTNIIAVDTGDGTGRSIFRRLEEAMPKDNLIAYAGNKKISIGFQKDVKGEVVFKDGLALYQEEHMSEWSVKHLKDLFYDGTMICPIDNKLDTQLNSVVLLSSGNRSVFSCIAKEDHLFDSFKIFSIAHWFVNFNSSAPKSIKRFYKG